MNDPYGLNDPERWVKPTHPAEVSEEARAAFYDAPATSRCQQCWNLTPCCTCIAVIRSQAAHPSNIHAAVSDQIVAGFHHQQREEMLQAYAERGIGRLEGLANGLE